MKPTRSVIDRSCMRLRRSDGEGLPCRGKTTDRLPATVCFARGRTVAGRPRPEQIAQIRRSLETASVFDRSKWTDVMFDREVLLVEIDALRADYEALRHVAGCFEEETRVYCDECGDEALFWSVPGESYACALHAPSEHPENLYGTGSRLELRSLVDAHRKR